MSRIRIAAAVVAVVSTACTWGMVGHDGGRTSASPAENGITPANVGSLHESWNARPGAGPSAPVTANGRVFVTTQPSGSTPGALQSFDAAGLDACSGPPPASCDPQWSVPMKLPQSSVLPPVAPPIVAGGSVWAGAHSFDLGLLTQLMAPFFTVAGGYDPSDGSRVSDNVISAGYPAEAGAEIFGYADNNISVGFGPGNRFQDYPTIDAVAEDGSSTRTVLVNPPFGAISVAGDRLYLALGGSVEVYDTKPATIPCAPAPGAPPGYPQYDVCTPLWSAVLHHTPSLDGLPVVANGLLYVSEVDGSVEVFDVAGCGTATCAPVWTARAGTVHVGELAVTGTTLFVPSDDGHLYAFPSTGCGASTCTPAWSVNAGSGTHAPAVAGSVVVAGTQDGRVIAVDARGCGSSTCPVLRSVAVGSPVRQPIAVSNGRVFALSDDGVLHGLAVG